MTRSSRPSAARTPTESAGDAVPGTTAAIEVSAILDAIGRGTRFLVSSHARPDGDAVGSVLAMGMLLEQMGKRPIWYCRLIPHIYRESSRSRRIRSASRIQGPTMRRFCWSAMGGASTAGAWSDLFLINIDHHYERDQYGDLNWIDHGAASVGEMVYRLAEAAGRQ